ncbi:universal stress protein [Porphyrobacter algicida]|uniref:Universal stress protein n=1 Tax=Qipengyuania algicida TaxID=1836209 RepID=A0A845AL89_9SPHN|nr:universal stress protein [Qipengyuania algicida]MXP30187.1 universal stress protein [Qipengyuania algicida]
MIWIMAKLEIEKQPAHLCGSALEAVMKNVVVHVQEDPGLSARVQTALDLARNFDGHVTCLQTACSEVIMPASYEAMTAPAILPILREQAEQLEAKVKTSLGRDDVPWDWQTHFGFPAAHLVQRAALADVIVMGTHDASSADQRPSRIVGQVVLRSPAPVLVVPDHQRSLNVRDPILIGWNGAVECANALRAALPLLKQAEQVFLTRIMDGSDYGNEEFTAIEGAQYLRLHGVECELLELPAPDGMKVANQLTDAALARECGLLVMGAYGRARIAEWLLGGVTRDILTHPQLPVLLAH